MPIEIGILLIDGGIAESPLHDSSTRDPSRTWSSKTSASSASDD
jgi:hypothetical protein